MYTSFKNINKPTVPRMLHKTREASSCGSGTEMANRGYQTTAHTTGDPVMGGRSMKKLERVWVK